MNVLKREKCKEGRRGTEGEKEKRKCVLLCNSVLTIHTEHEFVTCDLNHEYIGMFCAVFLSSIITIVTWEPV
jgi:hypothetical protein